MTTIQVGHRAFDAFEFDNEALVYDTCAPPFISPNVNVTWQLDKREGWTWYKSARTERYETRVLHNLRVYMDPGIDPLDFHVVFIVQGRRVIDGPLHYAKAIDLVVPIVLDPEGLYTFQLTSTRAYERALRMQFIFAGCRKNAP